MERLGASNCRADSSASGSKTERPGRRDDRVPRGTSVPTPGLDAVLKARHEHIKVATVGNPGLHLATWVGGLPGVSTVMTKYMNHKMEELDIPSIPEFIDMIADTGAGLCACKASVDLFGLEKNDFVPQVQDIITVGEFYEQAAGGQIIFT